MRYLFLLGFILLLGCESNSSKNGAEGTVPAFEHKMQQMVERWFPGRCRDFSFRQLENDDDRFELSSDGDQIVIAGTNGVAAASGFYWYLKNHCGIQISINFHTTPLPEELPTLDSVVQLQTPFQYRNFFNYCTFGYTTPWWTWEQWELLIDWMAMNGINMPLATTGQEAVWEQLLKEQGLSQANIDAFLTGPAFLPWGWMGNIDGMAGPVPKDWIEKHRDLQVKILTRERSFGMTPILQGFTGHIPRGFIDRDPTLKYVKTTDWAGMPGTYFLDPKDSLFTLLGKRFIEIQTELYGTDHLYDADCFNEVNPPTNDTAFISDVSRTVYQSMLAADPEAKWVMQGWFLFWQQNFWQEPQARALFDPIPEDRLLLLDLYGEKHTVWDKTKAFYGKPWIWNIICNNGQKVNLSGDLQQMNDNLQDAMHNPEAGNLQGVGVMMEGFGYNPVVQDLIGHLVWEPKDLAIQPWLDQYAQRRYGKAQADAQKAWEQLHASVYSRSIVGESPICYPPTETFDLVTEAQPHGVDYPVEPLWQAGASLLKAADDLNALQTYQFDVVHVFREILLVEANHYLADMYQAIAVKDQQGFQTASSSFLALLKELDELLLTNRHFLAGKWLKAARDWGDTEQEKAYYEMNARAIITLWQPSTETHLRDYASRQWNGMVGDFYYHRWERFIEVNRDALQTGNTADLAALNQELLQWELDWVHATNEYPNMPEGNPVQVAEKLFEKYVKPRLN